MMSDPGPVLLDQAQSASQRCRRQKPTQGRSKPRRAITEECFLEGQVHALMAPVLLRSTWFDALDLDAEPQPPDGELRDGLALTARRYWCCLRVQGRGSSWRSKVGLPVRQPPPQGRRRHNFSVATGDAVCTRCLSMSAPEDQLGQIINASGKAMSAVASHPKI
jgi:hypothetical protein